MDEELLHGLLFSLATIIGRLHGGLLAELTNEDEISNGTADMLLSREEAFIASLRRLGEDDPSEASHPLELQLMELVVKTASDTVRERLA